MAPTAFASPLPARPQLAATSSCLQAATSAPAKISLQNYGTATAQDLQFVLNGVTLTLPSGGGTFLTGTGTFVAAHAACFDSSSGLIRDCGVSVAAGNVGGVPTYSAAGTLASTNAPTSGQVLLGDSGAAAGFVTLSGDAQSLTAGGLLTLNKVNGVSFSSSYAAHGVLLGEGTSPFTSTTTSNIGYCLLSQGLSTDPVWAACASGSGSAGGLNTQVQFNSGTSLGGSANFTWVSPTLTLGVAGATTGQLGLSSSTATGTVTLQAPGVSTPYNFNFPVAAGTSGQPLISAGGGSTPNTFGTLGISGGGTNCNAASGTCLDNITGFGSTGYVKRTGAGTYAFASPIPVSDGGTALASGTSGGVLGFTASGTIASSAALGANGIVIGGGAGATPTAIAACTNGQIPVGATSAAPVCQTMAGDIGSITSGGSVTIANSAITVAKQANAAAFTLEGNFTGSSAAPQFSTLSALTLKAAPAGTDLLLIQDQAAAGALKQATISSVASAGSVGSVNALTGALTIQPVVSSSGTTITLAVPQPQGRLTLVTGTPVLASNQTAKGTLFYGCYHGNIVPYYNGTSDLFDTISSCEVSTAMVSAASAGQVVSGQVYDAWWVHGGGSRICLAMSASSGGGGGWASDTAGSNSARGTGYSQLDTTTRAFITNKNSITNCFNGASNYGPVSANQATYLGTIYATANGQTGMAFTSTGAGGGGGILGVYNAYNQVEINAYSQDTTSTWTISSTTWRKANNNANNSVSWVDGLQQSSVSGKYAVVGQPQSGAIFPAVGCMNDWSSGAPITAQSVTTSNSTAGSFDASLVAECPVLPQMGLHVLNALEVGFNATATTFFGSGLGAPVGQTQQLSIRLSM
jgi:hypothetical protein